MSKIPVITIDGPSGTGKGTISSMLAKKLGFHYLDSGALYRVLAHFAIMRGKDIDVKSLLNLIKDWRLKFDESSNKIILNNSDITNEIRSESCSQCASKIAMLPKVREALLNEQRKFARPPGLVTDGRDMGTVVFPEALLKIYLYASPEERAQRRFKQLKEVENDVSLAQVVRKLKMRDERDAHRAIAPLKAADDAIMIDTTGLSIMQVFENVLNLSLNLLNKTNLV